MIMNNIRPHIEMRTKVINSFESEIHQDAGEIVPYYKTINVTTRYVYNFGGDSSIYLGM